MEKKMKLLKRLTLYAAAALAVAAAGAANAQDKELTFAHQDMVVPFRVLIDTGELEKTTGYKISWKKFTGGGDVIRAMASGDIQIGEVGSSPAAAVASQGMDVEVFWILDDIANAEQLVARNGSNVNSVADLKGKKIGVPFVSTTHYQLLFALQQAGIGPKDATVLNMRPPEIVAAWERGDIDATFVWNPALAKVKESGKVLASAGELAKKGRPTFDAIMVKKDWAAKHKDFMVALVKAIAKKDAEYKAEKAKWTVDSAEVKSVAKISGSDVKDVPGALADYGFLSLDEQASNAWLGGGKASGVAKALTDTSAFLKEQGRVTDVAADYSKFVNDAYVKAALGK
jgi:taurine transport system substrate-binding protein